MGQMIQSFICVEIQSNGLKLQSFFYIQSHTLKERIIQFSFFLNIIKSVKESIQIITLNQIDFKFDPYFLNSFDNQKHPPNMSLSPEQQLIQFKTKYDNEVKKNNNLLKMNSNLMKENQLYQNCFSALKQWSRNFLSQWQSDQHMGQETQIDDSCIDIEEQGQEFVRSLTQTIEKKMNQLLQQKEYQFKTQRELSQQSIPIQQQQCGDCQRWKELYIKQSKQTSRLQKTLDESSLFSTQKQINIVKLKDDVCKLLEDYLILYRKQVGNIEHKDKQNEFESVKINNRDTVRIKDKSKEKRSGSSGSKPKKIAINFSGKEQTAFSKQKTNRNTKYTIQLNDSRQANGTLDSKILLALPSQLSQTLSTIISSFSEVSRSYEQENILLKQKLKDFNQILLIYRQKQRNRLIFR